MKETGILRRIDELGRIVIPKEIRKKLRIREGDSVDIYLKDSTIVLEKYSHLKDLETVLAALLLSIPIINRITIAIVDLDKIIATNHIHLKAHDYLDAALIKKIEAGNETVINKMHDIKITDDYQLESNLIIKPISLYGDLYGATLVFYDYDLNNYARNLASFVDKFINEYLNS